jgi:hypothetical protein
MCGCGYAGRKEYSSSGKTLTRMASCRCLLLLLLLLLLPRW